MSDPKALYVGEKSRAFRTAWELYMKFHTVFLTVNLAALGATIQYVKQPNERLPIIVAFALQNLLFCVTSFGMGMYSRSFVAQHEKLLGKIADEAGLSDSKGETIPPWLALWSGCSNGLGGLLLIGCWVACYFITAGN